MKLSLSPLLLVLMLGQVTLHAQERLDTPEYRVGFYTQNDLRNSSTNAITTQKYLLDMFRNSIRPKMGEKVGNISYEVFSFASTYMTLVWSHEFGHSLRADQVGGHFNIHNAALPIPHTTMTLPDDISLVDEALSVTAGFEVNYLNVRSIQREFLKKNGLRNEELSFAFANRIMFPLYTSVIVPIDPEERDVWINTAGDPVHVVLPVFKNYADGKVFMTDSTVNPDLVDFYNQTAMLGSFFNLLDPQFYKEVAAAFGDNTLTRRPRFLIGDYENGWTYGTLFNTSPLGYELYMNNYIHLKGNQFSLYLKYGRPFKNNGLGMVWNDILKNETMIVSASLETWDQDLFGSGISGEMSMDMILSDRLGVFVNAGYKTEGYVLGKQLDDGLNLGLGLLYYPIR